ncbi:bifunctional diguanylate cyclase/phosphodiesterase [Lacisediminimonas profundi]|uniref:bifunctional diguanylate cyclase/phosphodiesterase n=1 Tax=Lacisediminimonas profundi TaxID=2603856 RepID=UPI0013869520|nr:EAL domain-containing protein [Lacisediminimonas profundi]
MKTRQRAGSAFGGAAMSSARRVPVAWSLIYLLAALFLAVWLAPQLQFLKFSTSVMPVGVHTLFEMFSVIVAMLAFGVAWHAYDPARPANILILGCGLLCVALLDSAHLLSYKGMPDFVTPASPGKSINFWLCARYLGALTLIAVSVREWKPVPTVRGRMLLLAASIGLAGLIWYFGMAHPDLWPRTFIEGQGLTRFKVMAEYGIIALLLVPAVLFYRQRGSATNSYDPSGLFTATAITILAELSFTLYVNVNEVFSLLGHSYKILAFLFIYRAVFLVSVREPYNLLREEIAERKQAEAEIRHRVYHDPLTDLPNRLLMEEFVQQALASRGGHGRLALISLDMDHFQSINDSLGLAVGDDLLTQVAQRLVEVCGERCVVSRIAGDSFLMMLRDAKDEADVLPVLRELVARMLPPYHAGRHEIPLSVSIGVSLSPRDGRDFETLKRNADTAMYRARHGGRNIWRFFDQDMDAREQERMQMFGWLREAIDQGQFELYYQPQVALASGQVTGVEALLRWRHPQLGLVTPDRFIRVAEDTGLITEIGDWVLAEACRQAMQWQDKGLPPMTIAVNVSAAQFRSRQLERSVADALRASGLSPSLLELEMTESVLMHDSDHVLEAARALRQLGVRLAIDDFGTGYSSLSYLKRFAVSRLKIDRSFVADLTSDPDDAAIVRAIVEMARSLRLFTVAEGVENQATLEALRALGCDEGQGFLFARPMPAAELPGFLAAGSLTLGTTQADHPGHQTGR